MIHHRQQREARVLGREEPGNADIAAISELAMRDVRPDEVYVRRLLVANDSVDRDWERFPVAYLERFSQTLPGKPLLLGHRHGEPGIGRIYAAGLEKADQTHWVTARSYVLRHPGNDFAIAQIEGGVWSYVSIGAYCDVLICDLCGRDYYGWERTGEGTVTYCSHLRGERYDGVPCTLTWGGDVMKVEALEASLVWLGAQVGARVAEVRSVSLAREEIKVARLERLVTQSVVGAGPPESGGGTRPAEEEVLIGEARGYREALRAELSSLIEEGRCPARDFVALLDGDVAAPLLKEAIDRVRVNERMAAESLPTVETSGRLGPRAEPWAYHLL